MRITNLGRTMLSNMKRLLHISDRNSQKKTVPDPRKIQKEIEIPKDMDSEFREVYDKCKEYTMTSVESMYALYKNMEYVINAKISGDFVECGVWRGGSAMIIAYCLLKRGETHRKIYLYDTFKGMSKPTAKDKSAFESSDATLVWEKRQKNNHNLWCYSPLSEVKNNMLSTGYPQDNIIFVAGKVEDTIPGTIPSYIALLRLDTDWYESTYHELQYLYPLLTEKGVLIIDDYGHWSGAREATETYFKENNITMLLHRIDHTVRLGVKLQNQLFSP